MSARQFFRRRRGRSGRWVVGKVVFWDVMLRYRCGLSTTFMRL